MYKCNSIRTTRIVIPSIHDEREKKQVQEATRLTTVTRMGIYGRIFWLTKTKVEIMDRGRKHLNFDHATTTFPDKLSLVGAAESTLYNWFRITTLRYSLCKTSKNRLLTFTVRLQIYVIWQDYFVVCPWCL